MIRIKSPQLYRLSYQPHKAISDRDVGCVPTVYPSPFREEGGNYTNPGDLSLPGFAELEQWLAAEAGEMVRGGR